MAVCAGVVVVASHYACADKSSSSVCFSYQCILLLFRCDCVVIVCFRVDFWCEVIVLNVWLPLRFILID